MYGPYAWCYKKETTDLSITLQTDPRYKSNQLNVAYWSFVIAKLVHVHFVLKRVSSCAIVEVMDFTPTLYDRSATVPTMLQKKMGRNNI